VIFIVTVLLLQPLQQNIVAQDFVELIVMKIPTVMIKTDVLPISVQIVNVPIRIKQMDVTAINIIATMVKKKVLILVQVPALV